MNLDTLMAKFNDSDSVYAKRLARDPSRTLFDMFKTEYYSCLEDYEDPYEFFSEVFSSDELEFLIDLVDT